MVSESPREQATIDGIDVGEDVFLIGTQVGKNGALLMKRVIECRNRLSRAKRWKQLDEEADYAPTQLGRDIVDPSQIRTVIRTFREDLCTTLFPRRGEVPKTLILAKSDSHAADIIQIVREGFGEGNDSCKKIAYSADKPEAVLSAFRDDYCPRIAVTVDMIATGTDVRPIERLISPASRIIRLNAQMTTAGRQEFQETVGTSPGQTAQALLDAFDQDVIAAQAGVVLPVDGEPTPEQQALLDAAQRDLITAAVAPFHRPEVRDYIENVRPMAITQLKALYEKLRGRGVMATGCGIATP